MERQFTNIEEAKEFLFPQHNGKLFFTVQQIQLEPKKIEGPLNYFEDIDDAIRAWKGILETWKRHGFIVPPLGTSVTVENGALTCLQCIEKDNMRWSICLETKTMHKKGL